MTKGELQYAKRMALQLFEEWNDVTGVPMKFCSWYYELISLIEDAVDIGAKVACDQPISLDDYREIKSNAD